MFLNWRWKEAVVFILERLKNVQYILGVYLPQVKAMLFGGKHQESIHSYRNLDNKNHRQSLLTTASMSVVRCGCASASLSRSSSTKMTCSYSILMILMAVRLTTLQRSLSRSSSDSRSCIRATSRCYISLYIASRMSRMIEMKYRLVCSLYNLSFFVSQPKLSESVYESQFSTTKSFLLMKTASPSKSPSRMIQDSQVQFLAESSCSRLQTISMHFIAFLNQRGEFFPTISLFSPAAVQPSSSTY